MNAHNPAKGGGNLPDMLSFEVLQERARRGPLDLRTGVRIALYLSAQGCCVFRADALRAHGRAAGMNGAEMAANEAGTSHDAKGTACLAFVGALLGSSLIPKQADIQRMRDVGYRLEDVSEVMAQVFLHMMLVRMHKPAESQEA